MAKLSVKFTVTKPLSGNLTKFPSLLNRNLEKAARVIGTRLKRSAQTRMRKDTGTEQKSLTIKVTSTSQGRVLLEVYSTLVQAYIDAYGMRKGIWPDGRPGTPLAKWVKRRIKGLPVKQVKTYNRPKKQKGTKSVQKIRRVKPIVFPDTKSQVSRKFRGEQAQLRRLTFLVARSIHRKGIRPTRWNTRTLETNKRMIYREVSNSLARTVNELKRK